MIKVFSKDAAPVYKGVTILAVASVCGHFIRLYQSGDSFLVENNVAGNYVGRAGYDLMVNIDSDGYPYPTWIYSKLEAMQAFRECVASAKKWEKEVSQWEQNPFVNLFW